MPIKKCVTCDNEFNSKNPNKLYCSDECRTVDLTRNCIRCNKEFVVEKRSRTKKYCSKSCAVSTNNELGIMGKNAPKMKDKFRVILKCDLCGEEFDRIMSQVRKSQKKKSKHTFCGNECYQKYLSRNTKQRYCKECNEPLPLNYKSKNRIFCSKDCKINHHRVTLNCTYCSKEFRRGKANVSPSGNNYCSRDCWRSHKLHSSTSLDNNKYIDFRLKLTRIQKYIDWHNGIYHKYKHKCALCDKTENLHVHHIIPLYNLIKKITGEIYDNENFLKVINSSIIFDLNNGILLCEEHHKMCHNQ